MDNIIFEKIWQDANLIELKISQKKFAVLQKILMKLAI